MGNMSKIWTIKNKERFNYIGKNINNGMFVSYSDCVFLHELINKLSKAHGNKCREVKRLKEKLEYAND